MKRVVALYLILLFIMPLVGALHAYSQEEQPKYVWTLDASDEYHPTIHLLDSYQNDQIVELLQQYKTTPPDWVQQLIDLGYLTQAEWEQRVDNLINFYNEHGHLLIANGPFYLNSYDAQNDIAYLTRVADFPVDPADVAQELQAKTVDMEVNANPVNYNVAGTEIASMTINVNGQPATADDVKVYALLVNTNTSEAIFLNVSFIEAGQFKAILENDVEVGSYQLIIVAYPVGYSEPAEVSYTVLLTEPSAEGASVGTLQASVTLHATNEGISTMQVSGANYVQNITIQRIEDDQAAVGSLLFGDSQARLFRLRSVELINRLQNAGFNMIKAASGLTNILVNPTDQCQDGSMNVFQNEKARLALQFLIDRNEIVTQIYEGYAIPVILPWTPLDPDYPYLIATALKWKGLIDSKGEAYGEQLLQQALEELGATQGDDGKWYWSDGSPVTVKFVIRVEDQRKDIGDQLANKLEDLGLTVERLYNDFSGAYQIVYSGDPSACEWHLYTEGWGITGMTQYDYGNFVWFYSSIWGAMPGWGEPTYWNYENATIDEIAQKLDNGDYANETEFWQLLNEGVDLGVRESVRVFVAATYDFYAADPNLQGILPSPKASPWHTFTFMNLQYPQDTITMTNRYVYASGWAWNPVGGFQDFYSRPVVEAVTWPGITSRVTDGKTGWSPANTVEWSLERGPVNVSADAILYDPVQHKFVTAGEANVTTAKNVVTINYKLLGQIKFHDGTTETVADLLAPIYIIFEYGHEDNTTQNDRYEGPLASDYSTFLNTFVAVEIVNETTVKVYLNYDHIDPGFIASVASIWTSYPLELYAGMDLLWRYGQPNVQLEQPTETTTPPPTPGETTTTPPETTTTETTQQEGGVSGTVIAAVVVVIVIIAAAYYFMRK